MKQHILIVLAAMGLAFPAAAQEDGAPVPDGACFEGHDGPILQLLVQKRKKNIGQFRIELYPNDPDGFLESKARIYKYFTPVTENEDTPICLTVPAMGEYGLLVIHDMDGDSKPDFFSDGFGLSTNPKLALRRPKLKEALFTVDADETVLEIDLQYVTGNPRKRCRGSRCP